VALVSDPSTPSWEANLAALNGEEPPESIRIREWQNEYDRRAMFHADLYEMRARHAPHQPGTHQASSARASCGTNRSRPTGMSQHSHARRTSVHSGYASSVPGLMIGSSDTASTTSSAVTNQASDVPQMYTLEEAAEGVLEQNLAPQGCFLECPFPFLGCYQRFEDEAPWKTHTLFHFRQHPPPKTVMCPLCDPPHHSYPEPGFKWEARMQHMAWHHRNGQTLATARPDFDLFDYLWRKKIIDAAQLRALKGASGPYTVTQGSASRRDRHAPRRPPGGAYAR